MRIVIRKLTWNTRSDDGHRKKNTRSHYLGLHRIYEHTNCEIRGRVGGGLSLTSYQP